MTINRSTIITAAGVGMTVLAIAAGAQTHVPSKPVLVAAVPVVKASVTNVSATTPAVSAEPTARLITRETYTYRGTGRRDPFVSLMNSTELRPLFQDLKLVAVAWDATGRNSVAVLRDVTSKEQYRVKVGQEIGRMRVASIGQKSVVFGIEEFGYSRQETLAMNDSTKVRTQ
ncbi:MAG: hypothetical protein ABI875_04950 [Gemmatimonadales bacterium]